MNGDEYDGEGAVGATIHFLLPPYAQSGFFCFFLVSFVLRRHLWQPSMFPTNYSLGLKKGVTSALYHIYSIYTHPITNHPASPL